MPDFKQFFQTPQKARIAAVCLLAALVTLGAVIVYIVYSLRGTGGEVPPVQTEAVSDAPGQSEEPAASEALPTQGPAGLLPALTIDEARKLALADAGVTESEAQVTREALAEDNGIWIYEFRFQTGAARYEYKLNANTGEVRGMVKESIVQPSPEGAASPEPSAPADSPPPEETPPSDAPSPAQSAPADSPAPAPSRPASLYVGMERAKAAALERAGLSASQVRFTRAGMGRSEGRVVYEVGFRQGETEYAYEVDAATGRVLSGGAVGG